jgi:hypothetical protein
MHIPVLGYLFSHKSLTDQRTSIVVFLTPTILNPESGVATHEPSLLPKVSSLPRAIERRERASELDKDNDRPTASSQPNRQGDPADGSFLAKISASAHDNEGRDPNPEVDKDNDRVDAPAALDRLDDSHE